MARTRTAVVCVLAGASVFATAGTASATVFNGATGFTIPASGTVSHYPATADVSGTTGLVTDVNLSLANLNHVNLQDLGVVLVSPGGQAFEVFYAINGGSVSNINVTFDDQAAGLAPQGGTLGSGTYKPTEQAAGASYPSPGPGTDYANPGPIGGAATLDGTFGGYTANGTWKLYAVDFSAGTAGGSVGSWSLSITTGSPNASITPFSHLFPDSDPTQAPSAPRTFTATNTGQTLLHAGSASIGGTNPGDFQITEDDCVALTLPPGGTCTVNVAFHPLSIGSKEAQVRIPLEDLGTLTSEITGTGAQVPGNTGPAPAPPTTGQGAAAATGQRDAALAKCRKKKGKARKKCRTKAAKLPV